MRTTRTVLFGWLLLAAPVALKAQYYTNAQGGIFSYEATGGSVAIEGYQGPGNVNIPTNIGGWPVTSIDVAAFQSSSITSVTIPGSVSSIGEDAFNGCINLTNLTLDNGITNIGELAFNDCLRLSSLTIPGSVLGFGAEAFSLCTGLTNITLENGVTQIPGDAFVQCTSLTHVMIPDSVTSIESSAFFECTNLRSVMIPNTVTYIGPHAFDVCYSLTNVTIPASVTNLGVTFELCTNLTAITVDAANSHYSSVNGVLFDKSQSTIIEYPGGLKGSYAIPGGVTSIEGFAFADCASLTNITIPSGVTTIGAYAFGDCIGLTNVTIPASVTSLQEYAFLNCSGLLSVYFAGNAPTAGLYAFLSDNATAYYLPGTAGWSATFAGLPTAFWALPYPLILNNPPSLGAQSAGFGFTVSWATNISVVVQACANLANPVWVPLQTNALTNGSFTFSDAYWTNFPSRYYRLSAP